MSHLNIRHAYAIEDAPVPFLPNIPHDVNDVAAVKPFSVFAGGP